MPTFSYRVFLFILIFAPLAFGSVEHWSMMTVEIGTAFGLLLCLFGLRLSGEPVLKVPGLLPLLLLLLLMLSQLAPLPPFLIKLISPHSWQAYWPTQELAGSQSWVPVSVNRKETLQEFFRYGSYVLFYVLTIQVLQDGMRIKKTLNMLALLVSVIAFFAILQQFSADGRIYWFRPAPGGHPGGPWININQFTAFIEALCPLVLALFLFYRPRSDDSSVREKIVTFFSSPRSNLHLFLGFSFVLLVFSVFVSLCRGGIITIMASMVMFAVLAGHKRRNFGRSSLWVVLCIALIAVSSFGWDTIFTEFDAGFTPGGEIKEGRFTVWKDTLAIIRDFPVYGAGFGTYRDIYPSYMTLVTTSMFEHAHNDYLELLTDGGIIGFGLAVWFCITVLAHGWGMVKKRRDRFAVLVGVGAITSISALLMHSVVDFNLHSGAIGLYFFFICGLLVAVVNNRYTTYQTENLLPESGKSLGNLLLAGTACFFVVTSAVQLGVLVAGYSYSKVRGIYVTSHLAPRLVKELDAQLQRAMLFDPLEGLYPFYRGNIAVIKEGRDIAYDYFLKAASRQPMNGVYLQRVAMMLPQAQQEKAGELMGEGYKRAINKELLVYSWTEWLLAMNRRPEAFELLRDRFLLHPDQIAQMVPVMEAYQFTREELEKVLPQKVRAWIRYGDYLEKIGDIESSGYYREKALEYIPNEPELDPNWYKQLIYFYQRHRQLDKALEVVRRAVEALPEDASFHIMLGDYYRQEGITYRAREEYKRAVMLEPDNATYRRKLKKLELDIEFGN